MNRRPLKSRDTGWARRLSQAAVARGITPNAISAASTGFAALGALAFVLAAGAQPIPRAILLVVAAAACQARLVCNLIDGMVAVEGGRGAPDGPFWNEAPDRLSDILLFAGAGIAAGHPALGWAVAAGAVLTAYLRELGRAEGLPADFRGPMAKPQRMALLTAAALIAAVEPLFWRPGATLTLALWVIAAGIAVTALRRSLTLMAALKSR